MFIDSIIGSPLSIVFQLETLLATIINAALIYIVYKYTPLKMKDYRLILMIMAVGYILNECVMNQRFANFLLDSMDLAALLSICIRCRYFGLMVISNLVEVMVELFRYITYSFGIILAICLADSTCLLLWKLWFFCAWMVIISLLHPNPSEISLEDPLLCAVSHYCWISCHLIRNVY